MLMLVLAILALVFLLLSVLSERVPLWPAVLALCLWALVQSTGGAGALP